MVLLIHLKYHLPCTVHYTLSVLSTDDIPLKPLASPGAVRHSPPAPDQPASPVPEPPASRGPLVPLEGPRPPEKTTPPEMVEPGTAALAVAVPSCHFSRPDPRWAER